MLLVLGTGRRKGRFQRKAGRQGVTLAKRKVQIQVEIMEGSELLRNDWF